MANTNKTSRRVKVMKIVTSVFIVILLLCVMPVAVTACDGSAGRSNCIFVMNFRYSDHFTLPIKVENTDWAPVSTRYFKSRKSLADIYRVLRDADKFIVELHDDFILVQDKSAPESGYCIIYPKKVGRFNYIARNMACGFIAQGADFVSREILAPMHFIPALRNEGELEEGKEYELLSERSAVKEFYLQYGFEVEEFEDGMILKDPIGRTYGDTVSYFDDTVNEFKLTIHDGKIIFERTQGDLGTS